MRDNPRKFYLVWLFAVIIVCLSVLTAIAITPRIGDSEIDIGLDIIGACNIGFRVIHREKKWAPDLLYSRDNLLVKGRSTLRNIIKKSCVYTPGVLQSLRWYMLKIRNKNNPHYVSTLLLKKIMGK